MVLAPVLIRTKRGEAPKRYHSAAVGLSTDLKIKINPSTDTGKLVSCEFIETEPTSKGSPRKLFRVLDLDRDEMNALAANVTERIEDVYKKPAGVANPAWNKDEDDDLPF